MALPDLIEIVPLAKPVRAEVTVPGSKSITNRALILAALADGEVTLTGALWSEDTQVMTEALRTLGFDVRVENDPAEFCNRTITVKGQGGRIPKAGTAEKPLELFVGNAGTAARFLAAMVCLGNGVYRLSGVPRMHERPQAELFKALRELGYRVDSANDKLPVVIHGQVRGEKPEVRGCTVSITESSQFASALLLSAKHGGWDVKVAGDDDEEAPYVTMTEKLVEVFPWGGGKFQIEPDASSGSYFWAAECVFPEVSGATVNRSGISVSAWPKSRWQIDAAFFLVLFINKSSKISRRSDLGDSIMTAIAIAPTFRSVMKFTDLGRLRVQECERVLALRTELTRCGAKVVEEGDTLTVFPTKPGELRGAEIETYNDHRMAMCFAILGLKVPGIKLKNPACVKKTFPNFFQKLAAPPPSGLGVEIRDGRTGRKLEMEELFAD
ncbi:MAG: 3-phosphoshikimate 1-carboxyvinyltransferase [Verrucomicrobia bacterium]|nr:3-phosphoshikimate 1-carboxyvinyltransferase [Verrucomicrobiota bacterium]